MLFDQVHLEDQRFELRSNHDPFNVPDLADHLAGFVGVIRGLLKVRADAILEVDGFTNVNDGAIRIFHQVTAWFIRQGCQDAFDLLRICHRRILADKDKQRIGEWGVGWYNPQERTHANQNPARYNRFSNCRRRGGGQTLIGCERAAGERD